MRIHPQAIWWWGCVWRNTLIISPAVMISSTRLLCTPILHPDCIMYLPTMKCVFNQTHEVKWWAFALILWCTHLEGIVVIDDAEAPGYKFVIQIDQSVHGWLVEIPVQSQNGQLAYRSIRKSLCSQELWWIRDTVLVETDAATLKNMSWTWWSRPPTAKNSR